MRYYNSYVSTQKIKGRGHCGCVIRAHSPQTGDGILQDLIYEGLAVARKYATKENLARAGQKVLTILKQEGAKFLRSKADEVIEEGGKKVKEITSNLLAGQSLQEVGQKTKQDLKESYQNLKQTAPKQFKEVVDKAEKRIVEEFANPQESRLSDTIGAGMMKHHPKKRKQRGKGIKTV